MDRQDKERLDIHILHNPFPRAFTFLWDGFKYTIPANGELAAVYGVAVHGANRLVEKIIEMKHTYPQIMNRTLRKKYLLEVVPTINPIDIIGDPLKVEEIKSEEGFTDEVPLIPANLPVNAPEGFADDIQLQKKSSEMDVDEIDLNPTIPNEEAIPSEEELRREALADSLPKIAREEELNNMDYVTELKSLAKSLEINANQTKDELVKQILEKENK